MAQTEKSTQSHGISEPTSLDYSPERKPNGDIVYDDDQHVVSLDSKTEAQLIRKIDIRVVPVLCLMFLLAFLDKTNIANAQVFGLSKDLDLGTGPKYNTALVIFFVPYVVFEIPSNILLKKLKPHIWLSICMFFFGLISLTQGFTTSYGGLLAARFFLGIAETPMYPGAFYIISMWYKRHEAQKRFSFFFTATTLAGAFGGLLAAAIGKMDGVRGLAGWRWVFILEGLATCVIAIFLYFLLPDFPEDAKWLSRQERAYIHTRLAADQGNNAFERKITITDTLSVLRDFKIWVGAFMYFALTIPGFSYAYFAPSIIKRLGFSATKTQLYSVPPWAAAFVFCMVIAWASDKARHRFGFIIFSLTISLVGCVTLLNVYGKEKSSVHVEYGMLFLFVMGIYAAAPVMICWLAMNLGGHHRRSVGSALQIALGQAGGIVSVFTFVAKDAPRYIPGYSICISFVVLGMVLATVYFIACWQQNRSKGIIMAESDGAAADYDEHTRTELGDLAVDYKYML